MGSPLNAHASMANCHIISRRSAGVVDRRSSVSSCSSSFETLTFLVSSGIIYFELYHSYSFADVIIEFETMFEKFRHRSLEPENLDKGSYTAEEYEGCLVELRRVNEWLGDANALRDSLFKEIGRRDLRSFSVLDVGAGSGELLRVTAKWAQETNRKASLVGLELNERSAQAILDESTDFREISSVRASGFQLPFGDNSFDYAIQSLTLHHFDDPGAVKILREMARVARNGMFVIDLNRNPVAY